MSVSQTENIFVMTFNFPLYFIKSTFEVFRVQTYDSAFRPSRPHSGPVRRSAASRGCSEEDGDTGTDLDCTDQGREEEPV